MTKVWSSDGESPVRRNNPRGPPYSVPHDRYIPAIMSDGVGASTRSYAISPAENNDQDSEQDIKARRRIPVACGRCRKRKIRCSGPLGDNGCQNCKTAGSADCQFNRVASEEVNWMDGTVDFSYNTELARAVHCRESSQLGSYRSHTPGYTQAAGPVPLGLSGPYRNQSAPEHTYQPRHGYYVSSCNNGEYSEDSLDYSLSSPTYSNYSQDHIGISPTYPPQGPNRAWMPGTPSVRAPGSGLYFESDAGPYGPPQGPGNNQPFNLRSSLSMEPNHFSFSGMASTLPLPSPIISNDRVLPIPAGRINSTIGPLHRTLDGLPLPYSSNSMKAAGAQVINSGHLIGANQPTPLSYMALSTSPENGESYGTTSLPNQDLYTTSDTWHPTTSLTTDPALRSQDASSDLYYSHPGTGSRKASQSSAIGQTSQGGLSSSLSSDRLYQVPYQQQENVASQAPRNGSMEMPNTARHRPSHGSLRGT